MVFNVLSGKTPPLIPIVLPLPGIMSSWIDAMLPSLLIPATPLFLTFLSRKSSIPILCTQLKSVQSQHCILLTSNRCSQDQMTIMHENGDSHHARFSFSAFRFLEQQNQKVSTYYLHCITRLCEISTCNDFKVGVGSVM